MKHAHENQVSICIWWVMVQDFQNFSELCKANFQMPPSYSYPELYELPPPFSQIYQLWSALDCTKATHSLPISWTQQEDLPQILLQCIFPQHFWFAAWAEQKVQKSGDLEEGNNRLMRSVWRKVGSSSYPESNSILGDDLAVTWWGFNIRIQRFSLFQNWIIAASSSFLVNITKIS